MIVKIQQRSVYHKYAEVEIEIPNEIKDKDINKYLTDNEHIFTDEIDKAMDEAVYYFGSGVYEYDGMDEEYSDSEWRYECKELDIGGHL
tara:strand:+ start:440 stop:706 length:267 start_codon:yes stop_codon:yes gene_type:complete